MKISKVLSDLTDVSGLIYTNTMTVVLNFEDNIDSVDLVEDNLYVHLKLGLTQMLRLEYKYDVLSLTHTDRGVILCLDRKGSTGVDTLDITLDNT